MENQNELVTKKKWNGQIIIIALLVVVILGLVCYICYDKGIIFSSKEISSTDTTEKAKNNTQDTTENKEEEISNNETSITSTINKRLYSVNSDLHQQRYYLLLDDATYDMNQNFLNKKTYILDMNMVDGNEIVKEVDLASVFKPIAENYINSHKGNNTGNCTVEYFSATTSLTPPPIDYDKEVAFEGYYRCVNNNAETSLGSEIYAYNVETNTIRDLGSK